VSATDQAFRSGGGSGTTGSHGCELACAWSAALLLTGTIRSLAMTSDHGASSPKNVVMRFFNASGVHEVARDQ
jgi:hypothetical protein